ncbi:MAG: tetratricopeptide repeat protein [Chloroflexi bacterium]|nr:tetratricopeptide repeat protein [Chloroflexota bacterium]
MADDAKKLQDSGIAAYQKKNYEQAIQLFNQAADAFRAAGQKDKAVEMQVNIGLVHRALGENQQALDLMSAALATFQDMGDALRTAQVLGNMGGVYAALGDHEQAYSALCAGRRRVRGAGREADARRHPRRDGHPASQGAQVHPRRRDDGKGPR